jgi:hypothetical protein
MILVFSNRKDLLAQRFVEAWRGYGARMWLPAELSQPGWSHRLDDPGPEMACIGGERVPLTRIRGVITRLPSVSADDLPHIAPQDREYVAVEMTAFLCSWLTQAPFPVLNRPSAMSLMGPSYNPERWMALAASVGARLPWARRSYPRPHDLVSWDKPTVAVLGDRCFGAVDETLKEQARRIAAAAGAELVSVQFSDPGPDATFLGAHLWPDLSEPALQAALAERFGLAPLTVEASP